MVEEVALRLRLRLALALAVLFGLGVATPGVAAAAEDYVALGDSYSSGTGTRTYYDSGCQRSNYAYAKLIDSQRPNTNVTLAACSGAKTGDVLANQVSSLNAGTEWASITIGGNDAGFSNVITACAKPWWAANCNAKIDEAQSYINGTLPGKLDSVYSQIKSRAPNATVIVLSYPRLFMGEDCNGGTFFSGAEMTRLNQTADMLRDRTRERAQAAGSRFVFKDAIPPFIGHAVCSSTEWVNGLSNPVGESYHPNRTGHSSGYAPLVRSVMG